MIKSAHRFLIYGLIGLAFGVIDWFYLSALAHFSWGSFGNSILVVPVILLFNYGIWLVPVIPIGIYETKHFGTIKSTMLSCIAAWVSAMVGYYGLYAVLLSLGKLPNLDHLNILGAKDTLFWQEYWRMFNRVILSQFFEWTLIAIVCGSILGALLYRCFRKNST